jgi:hypothetical protein
MSGVRTSLGALLRRRDTNDSAVVAKLAVIQKELTKLRREVSAKEDVRVEIPDREFLAASREVLGHGRTTLGRDRLWILWQAVRNVAPLEGAAAEIGSFKGGSAYFIAAAFAAALGHEVPVEVIDTFEGHPQDKLSGTDAEPHHSGTIFTNTSYEDVRKYLSTFERVAVHQGEFSTVAPTLPDQRYSLVHVDVDIYESALDCLRYFGPRLVPGGVIVLDDWQSPTSAGIRRAAEEYLTEVDGFQSWNPHTKQLVLIKRG